MSGARAHGAGQGCMGMGKIVDEGAEPLTHGVDPLKRVYIYTDRQNILRHIISYHISLLEIIL